MSEEDFSTGSKLNTDGTDFDFPDTVNTDPKTAAILTGDYASWAKGIISELLVTEYDIDPDHIKMELTLNELDIDDLDIVCIFLTLENHVNIPEEVQDVNLYKFTVGDLVNLLINALENEIKLKEYVDQKVMAANQILAACERDRTTKEVNITITGTTHSGKTLLTSLITDMLVSSGMTNVTVVHRDNDLEAVKTKLSDGNTKREMLATIQNNKITIQDLNER